MDRYWKKGLTIESDTLNNQLTIQYMVKRYFLMGTPRTGWNQLETLATTIVDQGGVPDTVVEVSPVSKVDERAETTCMA